MTVIYSGPVKQREITSGTREWADHNVNCVKGCFNNCRYCYAKMMAKRFGRCKEDTWKDMIVNISAVEKKYGKYEGRVMFPSSHDIIDIPEVKDACLKVISKLLDAENEVLITTKPRLSITREICEKYGRYKSQIQFRFTITSKDDHLLSFWEPNAPKFEERFESLKCAYENDFKTSVSIEPFLDYIPKTIINKLSPYITESIWLGPMNYISSNNIPEAAKHYYQDIRDNYQVEHLQEIYEELKDNPIIKFKDSMINRLGLANCVRCYPPANTEKGEQNVLEIAEKPKTSDVGREAN
jgi:DNA repair photolyase